MGADLLLSSATFRASMAASAAAAAALGVALMAEFEAPDGFTHASRAGIGIIAVQVQWWLVQARWWLRECALGERP